MRASDDPVVFNSHLHLIHPETFILLSALLLPCSAIACILCSYQVLPGRALLSGVFQTPPHGTEVRGAGCERGDRKGRRESEGQVKVTGGGEANRHSLSAGTLSSPFFLFWLLGGCNLISFLSRLFFLFIFFRATCKIQEAQA